MRQSVGMADNPAMSIATTDRSAAPHEPGPNNGLIALLFTDLSDAACARRRRIRNYVGVAMIVGSIITTIVATWGQSLRDVLSHL